MTLTTYVKNRRFLKGLMDANERYFIRKIEARNVQRINDYTSSSLPEGERILYRDEVARIAERNRCFVNFRKEDGALVMDIHPLELRPAPTGKMNGGNIGINTIENHTGQYFSVPTREAAGTVEIDKSIVEAVQESLKGAKERLKKQSGELATSSEVTGMAETKKSAAETVPESLKVFEDMTKVDPKDGKMLYMRRIRKAIESTMLHKYVDKPEKQNPSLLSIFIDGLTQNTSAHV